MSRKKLVVLSGAGISAESGIRTFRDSDGLWQNHRIEDVATPEGFRKNPALVLDFYNQRRRQLKEVQPNDGHKILASLEKDFDICIITQNIDDLHERAGSGNIIHLHGELNKVRPIDNPEAVMEWHGDLHVGETSSDGVQLRPHVVWFGEIVHEMDHAIDVVSDADVFLIIGTSMQVYPAAGLIRYLPEKCDLYIIDPHLGNTLTEDNNFFAMTASEGMAAFRRKIVKKYTYRI